MPRKRFLIIHGVNLDMIGERESKVYGVEGIADINDHIETYAEQTGIEYDIRSSNIEGEIVNFIHEAKDNYEGIVIDPGAYGLYSYAIPDAIAAVCVPCAEVHFSNLFAREDFRHDSVIAPVCVGCITGFGKESYTLAIEGLLKIV